MVTLLKQKPQPEAAALSAEAAARETLAAAQREAEATRIARTKTEIALKRATDLAEMAAIDAENATRALAEAEEGAQGALVEALKEGREVPEAREVTEARLRLADALVAQERAQKARQLLAEELREKDTYDVQNALSGAAKEVLAAAAMELLGRAMSRRAELERLVAVLTWCRSGLSVDDREPGSNGWVIRDTVLHSALDSFLNDGFFGPDVHGIMHRPGFAPAIQPWIDTLAALRVDADAALPKT